LKLVDASGIELPSSPLSLSDVFFDPIAVIQQNGIEALLRGASRNHQQELDCGLVTDLRNMLFGAPGAGGMDLAALNINRGRDRGLASFNEIREDLGLQRYSSFRALTLESITSNNLGNLYASIDDLDPWVGFLAEQKTDGLGETLRLILLDQFDRLRDGDRLYFEANDAGLSAVEIDWVKNQSLSDVIERNAAGLRTTTSFTVEQEVSAVHTTANQQSIVITTANNALFVEGLDNYESYNLSIINTLGQRLYTTSQRAGSFGESRIELDNQRIASAVCVIHREDGSVVAKQFFWR